MTILPIIKAPDPMLKQECSPVGQVDDETRTLMDDMLETMYAAPGIGLAASQIGVLKRIIVVDATGGEEQNAPVRMADPELIEVSEEKIVAEEGCLSFPDHFADVRRPARIRVRYLDHENKSRELDAEGMLAVSIQHEMDHLDGVLFVDYLTALKRNIILRKMSKLRKSEEATPDKSADRKSDRRSRRGPSGGKFSSRSASPGRINLPGKGER